MKRYLIYGLVDPRTGQLRYVGKTVRSLEVRLYHHLAPSDLKDSTTHRANWIKGLLQAGVQPDAFVIEECSSDEELNAAERHLIAYFRSLGCDLTNTSDGGGGVTYTTEVRAKIGATHRGNKYWVGKHHTPETRAKMSAQRKGRTSPFKGKPRPVSAEGRTRLVAAGKLGVGRARSPETRAKMSLAAKKRWAKNNGYVPF